MPAVFTLDVENPHPGDPLAHVSATQRVLDLLAQHGITATIFFVAETAVAAPALVRACQAAGHEIALHSLDHQVITEQTPETFRAATYRAKALVEDICGDSVIGYRAPVFSLTPETVWAAQVLQEMGFTYSSSVLPGRSPLFSFPGAPRTPFLWPSGLVEFPAPVLPWLRLPYLGGIYLRYLPAVLISPLLRIDHTSTVKWSYCHPYDISLGDKSFRMAGVSPWANRLLMWNRAGTLGKLERLIQQPALDWHPGFRSLLPAIKTGTALPTFSPAQTA